MTETVAAYRMNPAEDEIVFGDELAEGMWVLYEHPDARSSRSAPEEDRLRGERFRRVTRLRRKPPIGGAPEQVTFIGEWVDGYQEFHSSAITNTFLVKKETPGEETSGS